VLNLELDKKEVASKDENNHFSHVLIVYIEKEKKKVKIVFFNE